MRKTAAAIVMLVVGAAGAQLPIVEETGTMTVYRYGATVIVLLDTRRPRTDLWRLAFDRSPEVPKTVTVHDDAANDAGVRWYFVRLRLLDGDIVCEKFAPRPSGAANRTAVLSAVAAGACR